MNAQLASRQVRVTPGDAFNQAVEMLNRGDVLGSEKIYRAILKQYPNHFETLANLAFILLTTERMEEAARLFRKALNQQPNSAVVHTQLARALQMLDRHEEALERAKRAIALNPELAEAHATLATALADLGHYDEALRALAQAIELTPDRVRFYYLWGHIRRWTADDPRLAALENSGAQTGLAATRRAGRAAFRARQGLRRLWRHRACLSPPNRGRCAAAPTIQIRRSGNHSRVR